MRAVVAHPRKLDIAVTPSPRTRHAELLRLCARIGYSPPSTL
ncbi:capsid protein [Mesorhizobium amorphae]